MKFFALPLLVTVFAFVGCSSDPASPDAPNEEKKETETAAEPKDEDMIGLTIEAAEAMASERGLKFRIVSVDGDERPVTMDYLPVRVNFSIEGGRVIKVTRG